MKYCPNICNHKNELAKWIPKKFREQEPTNSYAQPYLATSPKPTESANEEIKKARKALSALLKEEKRKRQKTDY